MGMSDAPRTVAGGVSLEALLGQRAWLVALARELLPADQAEDVAQEALTAAYARAPRGPLRPWLTAVVRRTALFRRRGDGRRRARESAAARDEALPSTADLVERVETAERVARELRALDEPLRTTLLLRFVEDLSAAEIARRTGVPEGTVRWRTKRALDELRGRLDRAFGGRESLAVALLRLTRGERGALVPVGTGTGALALMTTGKMLAAAAVLIGTGLWIGSERRTGADARARQGATRASAPLASSQGTAPTEETRATARDAREPASTKAAVPAVPTATLSGLLIVRNAERVPPIRLEVYPAETEDDLAPDSTMAVPVDEDGRFTVADLSVDQGFALRLPDGYRRPGSDMIRCVFHVDSPREGVELEVTRDPGVFGRLVDADGHPTAGLIEARFARKDGTTLDTGARAGADGFFEVFLASDEQPWREVWLEYQGLPDGRGKATAYASAVDGDDVGTLRLARGRNVRVIVRDPEGEAIVGATCRPGGTTDGDGRILLRDTTATQLLAFAQGHRATSVPLPEGRDELEVILEPAPDLLVEVQTAGGDPVGTLAIELAVAASELDPVPEVWNPLRSGEGPGSLATAGVVDREGIFRARCLTDETGRVRVGALDPGLPVVLRVLLPGGAALEERLSGLGSRERRTHVARLGANVRRLRPRVVDESGDPLEGARALFQTRTSGWGHYTYVDTDATGRLDALVLRTPGVHFRLSRPGFRPLDVSVDELVGDAPTIVLPRGYPLDVFAFDTAGQPVAGAELLGHGTEEDSLPFPAVETGHWRRRGLTDEPLALTLHVAGVTYEQRATPGTPVTFTVPEMGAVLVRWDHSTDPLAQEWLDLVLEGVGADAPRLSMGFHGCPKLDHRFDPVLPGTYEARLTAEGDVADQVLARTRIEVLAGVTTEIDL